MPLLVGFGGRGKGEILGASEFVREEHVHLVECTDVGIS